MIKAVIPVAGVGSMLRPHTHTQPKPLIPVAGKPILAHIVENLIDAGIQDFVFIIGHLGEKIETFVKERYGKQIRAEFVVQSPRLGLGHSIKIAAPKLQSAQQILIVLGDTIFDAKLPEFIESEHSVVGVQEVEDPRKFGVALVDDDGFLTDAVEKPNIPKSNLAFVGLYKIREIDVLIAALEEVMQGEPSETGEYHLTDGLKIMIDRGMRIKAQWVDNWFDCGKKESLLETNRILLERMTDLPDYDFENTVINPPVHISKGAIIRNSIVGPYVAVDENARIDNSIVKNSILGAYSALQTIVIENSVIGSDALLAGKAHSVNIGDNNQIDFND